MITRLWNLTCLRKTLHVSSSHLENPSGFPQIPQPRRRQAILGVHQNGAGSEGVLCGLRTGTRPKCCHGEGVGSPKESWVGRELPIAFDTIQTT